MKRPIVKARVWGVAGIQLLAVTACQPGPELHLHDGMGVSIEMPLYTKSIEELWNYDLEYRYGVPSTYHWQNEWIYGWDANDERENGAIGYKTLRQYQIRRYYLGSDKDRPHDLVRSDYCLGSPFRSSYNFGYYDILLWNDPDPIDGVDSNHFEEVDGEDVICYTNASMTASRYDLSTSYYAYYAPDELFSAYQQGLFISRDPNDYDGYDELGDVYTKRIDFRLEPRTFIYLTQLIIHNNQGRATGTGGVGMLSGMARSTNINTGQTSKDVISVTYTTRMKSNLTDGSGETVDVIGGRLVTFGVGNTNPNTISYPMDIPGYVDAISTGKYGKRAGIVTSYNGSDTGFTHHYMDVNIIFYNGCDSTFVFDVTDQVLERFRGGVISFEIDMDTIPIPQRGGGSGFNAGVNGYQDGGTHEIPL